VSSADVFTNGAPPVKRCLVCAEEKPSRTIRLVTTAGVMRYEVPADHYNHLGKKCPGSKLPEGELR
jgi:hypothetical protein